MVSQVFPRGRVWEGHKGADREEEKGKKNPLKDCHRVNRIGIYGKLDQPPAQEIQFESIRICENGRHDLSRR